MSFISLLILAIVFCVFKCYDRFFLRFSEFRVQPGGLFSTLRVLRQFLLHQITFHVVRSGAAVDPKWIDFYFFSCWIRPLQ